MGIESTNLTYVLAAANVLLCTVMFVMTLRPVVTVFHLVILCSVIGYGVVPACSTYLGYNLFVPANWSDYNLGLVCQNAFLVCYSLGYMLVRGARVRLSPEMGIKIGSRSLLVTFVVGLAAVALIQVLSRGAWIASDRSQAIGSMFPGAPILFRLAVIPLSVMLVLSYLHLSKYGWRQSGLLVVLAGSSLIMTMLLFQRGMVLNSLMVILWIMERMRVLNLRRAVLGGLAVLIGIVYMRSAAYMIILALGGYSMPATAAIPGEGLPAHPAVISLIKSFQIAEIWPVTLDYTRQTGLLLGKSLIAWPTTLVPLTIRSSWPIQTGPDLINYFMFGEDRLRSWFGVNITFPQELFMNFGYAGMLFGFVPGLAVGLIDQWLRRVKTVDAAGAFVAYMAFFSAGFAGDFSGTLQYALSILLILWGVRYLLRLRVRRPEASAST